jgi:hypothetical protein
MPEVQRLAPDLGGVVNKNPRARNLDGAEPCGSVHEEPEDYRHLCQLPTDHDGEHECWSEDATW